MKQIRTDPEIIVSAVVDGINKFVRDGLLPNGVINAEAYRIRHDMLNDFKYAVAAAVAKNWEVSYWNDEQE